MNSGPKHNTRLMVSIAVIKQHWKQLEWGKSRQKLKQGRDLDTGTWRQEPGGRNCYRGHGGVLPTSLLLRACSACFLTWVRTTSPGVATPTWAGTPPTPRQLLVTSVYHRFSHRSFWKEHFLSCSFLKGLYLISNWHKTYQCITKHPLSTGRAAYISSFNLLIFFCKYNVSFYFIVEEAGNKSLNHLTLVET